MKTLTRSIASVAMAVAVIAPVGASATASAAPVAAKPSGKHFTVVQTMQKAKLGVCKVSVGKGAAWRVYGRLDTRKVRAGKFSATLYVFKEGVDDPTSSWRSPMVKKGTYSKVGSVRLPKKAGYTLAGGIGGGNMGNGGPIDIARVGKC
ncbi:hypothetical protein ACIRN4_02635 [Pimelobacter simplex]|uniref:hypothetical protein n=1 Tax=Nocardioides simplex TaxID=2045 RepID=UPI003827C091